jgi:hypothetical protein
MHPRARSAACSEQINGDWETQRVRVLGTGNYSEYDAVLENSFSEPLLRTTPWAWYSMLAPVRSLLICARLCPSSCSACDVSCV